MLDILVTDLGHQLSSSYGSPGLETLSLVHTVLLVLVHEG